MYIINMSMQNAPQLEYEKKKWDVRTKRIKKRTKKKRPKKKKVKKKETKKER